MTHYIVCPVCKGRIGFNLEELETRRNNHQSTSVYCPGNKVNEHYHPGFPGNAYGSYPPTEIIKFNWADP